MEKKYQRINCGGIVQIVVINKIEFTQIVKLSIFMIIFEIIPHDLLKVLSTFTVFDIHVQVHVFVKRHCFYIFVQPQSIEQSYYISN